MEIPEKGRNEINTTCVWFPMQAINSIEIFPLFPEHFNKIQFACLYTVFFSSHVVGFLIGAKELNSQRVPLDFE